MALEVTRTGLGHWRCELRPNRSQSWAETKRFFYVLAAVSSLIAGGFAWHGLWWVAPFSGLEVAAVGVGLYCCSRATYRRQVILVSRERLVVVRTGGRRDDFQRAWACTRWRPDGSAAGMLQIGSHGRFVDVGEFLSGAERRRLADTLGSALRRAATPEHEAAWPGDGLNREMGF
ncbi:DUF2244 domain-containing protein [Immundisolibacter sp.]|uniref:DUF2244 domain-containing protein n=1 Tax=Immundisolibacter sp. TaxID=1934948 RepID=UPI0035673320